MDPRAEADWEFPAAHAGVPQQDRPQGQLSLVSVDLDAVAVPLAVQLFGGEVAPDQVRCPPLAPPGRVVIGWQPGLARGRGQAPPS